MSRSLLFALSIQYAAWHLAHAMQTHAIKYRRTHTHTRHTSMHTNIHDATYVLAAPDLDCMRHIPDLSLCGSDVGAKNGESGGGRWEKGADRVRREVG